MIQRLIVTKAVFFGICATLLFSGCALIFPSNPPDGPFPTSDKLKSGDKLIIAHLKADSIKFRESNAIYEITDAVVSDVKDVYKRFGEKKKLRDKTFDTYLTSSEQPYVAVLPGGTILISEPMVNDSTGAAPGELALFVRHALIHTLEGHYETRLKAVLTGKYGGMGHHRALKKMGYLYSRDILIASGGIFNGREQSFSRDLEDQAGKAELRMFTYRKPVYDGIEWQNIDPLLKGPEAFLRIHPHKEQRIRRLD